MDTVASIVPMDQLDFIKAFTLKDAGQQDPLGVTSSAKVTRVFDADDTFEEWTMTNKTIKRHGPNMSSAYPTDFGPTR